MSAFGDQLRSIIELFQLKYINVASVMQYDASYISKWINSDVLPSSRSIRQICRSLADYVVANCNEDQMTRFCELNNLPKARNDAEMRDTIITLLGEAFQLDISDRKVAESEKQNIFEDRLQTMKVNLHSTSERSDTMNMTIIGDIATLREEDMLFLMDIITEINSLPFKNGCIDILISNSSIEDAEAVRPIVALLNFLMLPKKIKSRVNTCRVLQAGLMIITDNIMYTAQCRVDSGWLSEIFTKDVELIRSKTHIMNQDIVPVSRGIYSEHDIMPLSSLAGNTNTYWIYREKQLLGGMDMSYCIPEVQKKIFHDQDDEMSVSCLKQYKSLIRMLESGKEHHGVVYRDAMEELVYNGTVSVAGKEIKLSVIERLMYLQGLVYLLEQYSNLKIRLIDGYIVDEVKHRFRPNVYMSQNSCGFLMFPKNGECKYCLIHNTKFYKLMERMFDNLWEQNGISHYDIREYLNIYIQFCQDIVLLDDL